MKKMLFLFNPRSGKEQIKSHLLRILDIFSKAGYDIHVHVTQCQLDARKTVEHLGKNVDVIVCSGGDGTLNETISGMLQLKKTPSLGYIPAGSTNDFASSLKISKNMEKAAREIVNGFPVPVDAGMFCGDRSFIYIAAFGAFTEVSYQTPQDRKNLLGHQAYMIESVKSLASIKPYHMRVEWDDQILEEDFVFGMVTNSRSVGGFKGIVGKEVIFDDGEFEVTLIKTPKNPIELNEIVASLLIKQIDSAHMYSFKAKEVKFESIEEIPWTLDGEFGGEHDCVDIRNWKQGMRIMVKSQMIQQLSVKGRIENTQILEEVGLETEEISEK